MVLRIFKIALRWIDWHVFMWQSVEKLEYHFLVERFKFEDASIPYQTDISEADFKTNNMVSTKWLHHK